jgi:hypothetical protein
VAGELCDGHGRCLNVPACDVTMPMHMYVPSNPDAGTCVARCGCTATPGQHCGLGAGFNDCIKNAQFNISGTTFTNAIANGVIGETADETIMIVSAANVSKQQGWVYDRSTKLLRSVESGRCLGRWQNPPPPPPAPPGPPGSHSPRVATAKNIQYIVNWIKGTVRFPL